MLFSGDTGIVSHLESCAVIDAEDWTCSDLELTYFMAHGEYSVRGGTEPSARAISWWRWHYLKARDALS